MDVLHIMCNAFHIHGGTLHICGRAFHGIHIHGNAFQKFHVSACVFCNFRTVQNMNRYNLSAQMKRARSSDSITHLKKQNPTSRTEIRQTSLKYLFLETPCRLGESTLTQIGLDTPNLAQINLFVLRTFRGGTSEKKNI